MDDLYLRAIQGTIGCKTTKDAKVAATRARFAKDFDSSINVVYDALRNDTQQDLIIYRLCQTRRRAENRRHPLLEQAPLAHDRYRL